MVQTKRNQEKVFVTKTCLYGSVKTGQKLKVFVMENNGSVAKIFKMRGTNPMLTSKLHVLLNILAPC